MEVADLDWLRSRNEILGANLGAVRRGQFTGVRVDIRHHDSLGSFKGFDAAVFAKLMRLLHELDPDRQSAVRAFQFKIAIVVESHPNCADDLGGKSDKPSIARSAGLASG